MYLPGRTTSGASDEGPSHLEVQFLFTERHYQKQTKVQMVSTRCSGDSYLNRVELQNSCLARGHANTFIPSTLNGAPTDESGKKFYFLSYDIFVVVSTQ